MGRGCSVIQICLIVSCKVRRLLSKIPIYHTQFTRYFADSKSSLCVLECIRDAQQDVLQPVINTKRILWIINNTCRKCQYPTIITLGSHMWINNSVKAVGFISQRLSGSCKMNWRWQIMFCPGNNTTCCQRGQTQTLYWEKGKFFVDIKEEALRFVVLVYIRW